MQAQHIVSQENSKVQIGLGIPKTPFFSFLNYKSQNWNGCFLLHDGSMDRSRNHGSKPSNWWRKPPLCPKKCQALFLGPFIKYDNLLKNLGPFSWEKKRKRAAVEIVTEEIMLNLWAGPPAVRSSQKRKNETAEFFISFLLLQLFFRIYQKILWIF